MPFYVTPAPLPHTGSSFHPIHETVDIFQTYKIEFIDLFVIEEDLDCFIKFLIISNIKLIVMDSKIHHAHVNLRWSHLQM